MKTVVFVLWLVCHIGGFVFASYGVLRESFATVAIKTGAFTDDFDREAFDVTGWTLLQEWLVWLGIQLGLLPTDEELNIQDRKRNAAFAIGGVLLLGLSILLDLWLKWLSRESS